MRAPLRYEFPADAALKRFKFRRQLHFAPAFASLLAPLVRDSFAECDALLPVPLHRWRQVHRGFNQADEICRWLARTTHLPIVRPVARIRPTRAQTGLSAKERRRNLARAFVAREKLTSRLPLVVDDVVTTGSTCNELAQCLIDAGAAKVGVLAVARSA